MLPWLGPLVAEVTFGRYFTKSSKVEMLSCCRVSAVSAWIVIGTSCMFSVRRCAWTTPAAELLRIVAIAQETLGFMIDPPGWRAAATDALKAFLSKSNR